MVVLLPDGPCVARHGSRKESIRSFASPLRTLPIEKRPPTRACSGPMRGSSGDSTCRRVSAVAASFERDHQPHVMGEVEYSSALEDKEERLVAELAQVGRTQRGGRYLERGEIRLHSGTPALHCEAAPTARARSAPRFIPPHAANGTARPSVVYHAEVQR